MAAPPANRSDTSNSHAQAEVAPLASTSVPISSIYFHSSTDIGWDLGKLDNGINPEKFTQILFLTRPSRVKLQ